MADSKCCLCGNVRPVWDYMEYNGCDLEPVCEECFDSLGYEYFVSLGYDYGNQLRLV